ncbi:DNA circularization protein, partial [Salmonella enterica]|nr:DNA circularization protein [Salmonella enterica]EEF8875590.1 DNA circularization protein [Salmonella enterica]MFI03245.1 DNA circularization protein [Salmonella enterica]
MAFFSSTGWRGRLRDASFRGVPFSVEDDESTFGRRVQVHEYPNRDKPWTEDLGRATRRLTINAYLVGDDYADRRDRLISAIETAGPGTLVHPQYGEMQGSIDGQVRITHSSTEGRMCRVSFQFVESGELSFPVAGMATAKRLET